MRDRKDSHKTQWITASDNLAVEDHQKVLEYQCSDVEMFSAVDPDIHDSITERTYLKSHRSIGDEERSAERSFTAQSLHKDIEMLYRQFPDSPKPKKERPTLHDCDEDDDVAQDEERAPRSRKPGGEGLTHCTIQKPVGQEPFGQEQQPIGQDSVNQQLVGQRSIDQERIDGMPAHGEPVDNEPIGHQPRDSKPVDSRCDEELRSEPRSPRGPSVSQTDDSMVVASTVHIRNIPDQTWREADGITNDTDVTSQGQDCVTPTRRSATQKAGDGRLTPGR
ncbi:hypothetical protein LTR49_026274 [Elasticomyces elasticus]|nr:hypothetical protein LTR49_026274 [Elasticomyces elasticus]